MAQPVGFVNIDLTVEQHVRLVQMLLGDPARDLAEAYLLLHPEAVFARTSHLLAIRFQQVTLPAIHAAPLSQEALLAEFDQFAYLAFSDPYFMQSEPA